MTDDDVAQFSEIVLQAAEISREVLKEHQKLAERMNTVKNDKQGVSLLKVKNHEMISYIGEVTVLMSKMMKGDLIQTDAATKRALKHRVFLEKMRPIEDKMRPQIEKLLARKSENQQKQNLRVRLENMDVKDDDENEEEEEDEEQANKNSKKYVAPKIRAVHYEDDEEAPANRIEKAKRRAMQSSLIMELKNQYSEAPEVIREISERKFEYDKEREKYEEEHFTRIRLSKEQKRKSEKLGKAETLDDLLNFGDYMMRDEEGRSLSEGLKRKRLASGSKMPLKKKKKTQKERKKAAIGKKEGRKRAIRRRQ